MKLVAEYLEEALKFERMATEAEGAFKEQLLWQAEEYRRLAHKRAAKLGLPVPPPAPPQSN
jgi:serine/threonine-protein kinase RIO1